MKILDVYAGEPNKLEAQHKGAEVEHIEIHDTGLLEGEFDVVIATHSLQTVERENIPDTVSRLATFTKPGGEVWITVPSLEWALMQIKSDNPSPAFHFVMYGTAGTPTRSGFAMVWLRQLMEQAGLITRRAVQEIVELQDASGGKLPVLQNTVVGLKVRG